MRRPLAVLGALSIAISGWAAVLLGTAAPASAAWSPPVFDRSIGGSGLAGVYAWGLQYNPVTDEILVGDYFNFNVRRFDRDGNQLGAFGRPATERSGQPYSLAVDPRDGSVYVPEIGDGQPRGYIAKYDRNGKFLYEFNSGAKYYAWIATDKEGYLYIADSHYWNNAGDPPKIRKYRMSDSSRSATQVASFGSFGTGPGQLNTVRGITVADNGDIYVADGGNNVVTHFRNDGQYVRTLTGNFGGDLRGITLDEANDALWLVDADGGNIERLSISTGQPVRTFGSMGEGNLQFADGGRQLDVTPDGHVWVADYGNFRIQRFDPTKTPANAFVGDYPNPATQPAQGLLSKVRDVATAPDGSVLIADTWNHRFQRFGADGTALGSWGRRSSSPPYGMNYPRGIGVDPSRGDVWAVNTREHTIRVYDSSMNYRFDVGSGADSTATGSMRWPLDVDFYSGTAVVADYIGDRVKGFSTSTGAELWSLDSSAVNQVHGVAVDAANDRLYTVSNARDRIDVFRLSSRSWLTSYGSNGTTAGRFSSPWDVELHNGLLYVSDVARNKVIVYSTSGQYQGEFGSAGNGPGQFRAPSGLDVGTDGKLYVADSSNFRVQVFSLSGAQSNNGTAPVLTIGAPAKGSTLPSGPVELSGTATDPDGVASVEVSVRDETTGKVWDVNSSSWSTGGRWPVAALRGSDRTAMTWRWSFPAGIEGRRYTVRVRGYDAAGNLSVTPFVSSSFTVSNAAPDLQTPVAVLFEPVKNQTYTDRPAVIRGTATDDVGVGAVQVAVKDRANSQWWDAATGTWGKQAWHDSDLSAPGAASSTWSYAFDDSAAGGSGGYYVAVRAKDTSNKLQPSFGLPFDVDDSPPPPTDLEAPEVALTSPVLNQGYVRPVTVTGTATDDRGVAVVQVAVKDRNKATEQWWNPLTGTWGPIRWTDATLTLPGGTSTGWTWVFDDRAVPGAGDYFVQVRATDTAAKVSPTVSTRFSAG
jgi:DNA-binding beta-propeller fold protein YncE